MTEQPPEYEVEQHATQQPQHNIQPSAPGMYGQPQTQQPPVSVMYGEPQSQQPPAYDSTAYSFRHVWWAASDATAYSTASCTSPYV